MKKMAFFALLSSLAMCSFAFDSSLKGSWGLISDGGKEKTEFIRFDTDEIVIMDMLFRQGEFEEAVDSIAIKNSSNEQIMVQYYRLANDKLLFILTNTYDYTDSIILILTKF